MNISHKNRYTGEHFTQKSYIGEHSNKKLYTCEQYPNKKYSCIEGHYRYTKIPTLVNISHKNLYTGEHFTQKSLHW